MSSRDVVIERELIWPLQCCGGVGRDCSCEGAFDGAIHDYDCLIGAIYEVSRELNLLGNADVSTSMRAIEALRLVVKEGFAEIASAVSRED